MVNYQVQSNFYVKGNPPGSIIELDPNEQTTTDLIADGAIAETIAFNAIPVPDSAYLKFRRLIQGSPIFAKVFVASKTHQPVQASYALVMNAIDNREPGDFTFAILDLVAEMDSAGVAFSASEKDTINDWLDQAGFHFTV